MSLPSASRSHWLYPAPTRILLALLPVLFPAQVAFAPRPATPNANTESTTSQRGVNLEGEHIRQAQIASVARSSTGFKLVARQLIDSRTPAGYAKVESFALHDPNSISAELAWLVAGYAHILDHDYAKAIAALKQPRPAATLVDDYIAYFLATCYAANGDNAGVVQTLQNFDRDWPESLLIGDATVLLANASLALGNPQAAIVPLE